MTIQAIDVCLKEIHGQEGTFYHNCVPINHNNLSMKHGMHMELDNDYQMDCSILNIIEHVKTCLDNFGTRVICKQYL